MFKEPDNTTDRRHTLFLLSNYRWPMRRTVSPSRTFHKSVIALKEMDTATKHLRLKINESNLTDTDKKRLKSPL